MTSFAALYIRRTTAERRWSAISSVRHARYPNVLDSACRPRQADKNATPPRGLARRP
jgi:uncharacterized protein (DUF2384 family)